MHHHVFPILQMALREIKQRGVKVPHVSRVVHVQSVLGVPPVRYWEPQVGNASALVVFEVVGSRDVLGVDYVRDVVRLQNFQVRRSPHVPDEERPAPGQGQNRGHVLVKVARPWLGFEAVTGVAGVFGLVSTTYTSSMRCLPDGSFVLTRHAGIRSGKPRLGNGVSWDDPLMLGNKVGANVVGAKFSGDVRQELNPL
eukprot:CAMPEP_0119211108 /NCGR_PEP_ID=MMETSP1327-20130426/2720_1 /TAXON_ID=38833 /ORGANISM="Micromonas pusilla, Strain RCC2306" /LENGTH=196 /DNA_ID=CAMNT_0007208219 /DNA_START=236 /DNA_END=822 /DNA_ORIENTATION=-